MLHFKKTNQFLVLFDLRSGSCHFNRASNDKFSVEFWIFGIVIFFNWGWVLKFGAPSRYFKDALTQKRSYLVNWTSFGSDFNVSWKKNQNKYSKFNAKLVIWRPVEMTWSAQQLDIQWCYTMLLWYQPGPGECSLDHWIWSWLIWFFWQEIPSWYGFHFAS